MATRVDEDRITRFHLKIVTASGITLLCAALDLGILSFALADLVTAWKLGPFEIGVIAIVSAVGTLPGAVLCGNAADRIGRRATIELSLGILALGTVLGAVSWDYISLAGFQFLAGLGLGGLAPIANAYVAEFSPARHRGRLSAFITIYWVVGSLAAVFGSLLILPAFGWRIAFVFGGVPLLWVLLLRHIVPESPRYLVSRGKQAEARGVLARIKAESGLSYDHLMEEPSHQNRGLMSSLRELLSRVLIRRTICTWLLWFVLIYSYNGIFIWLPTLLSTSGMGIMRSIEYMLVFTAIQIPAILGAAHLVDRIGRKRVLVPMLLLCSVASYIFGRSGAPGDILMWGSLISFSNIIAFGIGVGYTTELFPTRLRGTGAGSASAFGRIGGILVPGVMAVLIGNWSHGYELVFIMFAAVLLLGGLAVAVLGEETKLRALEEIGR